MSDYRRRMGLSLHRSLLLIFVKPPTDPNGLQVNHIDGEPGNNHISNLEWTTPGENIKHAYRSGLIEAGRRAIIYRNINTGEDISFDSIVEASEQIPFMEHTIHSRLKHNSGRVFTDGIGFKYDDGSPWLEGTPIAPLNSKILIKNVFTGEQILVDNARIAGEVMNLVPSGVLVHVNREFRTAFNGFVARRVIEGEKITFPIYNDLQLKLIAKRHCKPDTPGWWTYCKLDGSVNMYFVQELMPVLNLSESQVRHVCNKGISTCGNYFFKRVCPFGHVED